MLEMGDVPKVVWQQPGFMFSVHASMKEHGLRCFRQRSACAIFLLFSFSTLDYFLRKRWRNVHYCLCAAWSQGVSIHPICASKQATLHSVHADAWSCGKKKDGVHTSANAEMTEELKIKI